MNNRRRQSEPNTSASAGASAWLAIVVLAAAVGAVYGRSLDAPFLFDDDVSVLTNGSIRSLWPLMGTSDHRGPLNPPIEIPTSARPLVNLSFALNYYFGGVDPRGYRAVNIVLHVLCAMLLWAVVRRTLRPPFFDERVQRAAGPLALAVALLWAVHPLATEAVVYVTQRTELMVVFFYLATLYFSLRYWAAASQASRRTWLSLATLACLAGAASKEVVVTAPLVVLLFEWTFFGRSLREIVRCSWPLYVGLFASWVLIAVLQLGAPRNLSAGFGAGVPLFEWWCTQAQILVMYLKLAAWPTPLLVHYRMPQLETIQAAWPYVLAVAALAFVTLGLLWRRNAVGLLVACVLLILAPTHVVPIVTEVAAERRMYLPLAGLVALLVVGMYWCLQRLVRRPAAQWPLAAGGTVVLILASVYGVASARRLETYHDLVALWQEVVDRQPANQIAQMNLAVALSRVGHSPGAIEHFRAALQLQPDFEQARYALGMALAADGQNEAAIAELQTVVRQKPDAYRIRNNLGVVLFAAGRLDEAIAEFEKTLELRPDFVEAQENLNRARRASVLPKKSP
jgi:Flp pilus assembly protein TadD